jgi:hypothetical protein
VHKLGTHVHIAKTRDRLPIFDAFFVSVGAVEVVNLIRRTMMTR